MRTADREPRGSAGTRMLPLLGLVALTGILLAAHPALAGPCSRSASMVDKACRHEIRDDYWTGAAACINLVDTDERDECLDDAFEDFKDGAEECSEQNDARQDLCDELGEGRYDPDFDPEDFETEFTNQNAYYPLAVGNQWVFEAEDEVITVEVLDKTKNIDGVTCIVVNDLVTVDGRPLENTDDWYGQASNGDAYYCGEISENFELFDGDDPDEPELVDIEGSWKAFRDGAQPGVIMFAMPEVGTIYRQEVSWGDAEDAAEVLANDYHYGEDPELDELVPQDLAELLCDHDCVVTREFTPVEPGIEALKYYSPGIGPFLEVEDGEIVQLVECNMDPRCDLLPTP